MGFVSRLPVVLTLAAVAAAVAQDAPVIRPGDTVQGTVEDGSKPYRLEIERAGTYRVELRSYLFDAYLVVHDGEGRVVGEDDDGLIASHSRVVLEAPATGSFTIDAGAKQGGRGPFELSVLEGAPPELSSKQRRALEIDDARRCLEVREEVLGPEHLDVATSLNTLAGLLRTQHDFAQARPLLERALAIREKALGPEDRDVAQSLNNLATILMAMGEFDEARPLAERALAIREQLLGPDHLDVATCLNNLALLMKDQGDLAGARPLYERALAIREQQLGPDHPDVATSLNNLALLLQEQGDLPAARPLLERALAIREQALGGEHPDVATNLNNLALLLQEQGDPAAARPLLERALAIREQAFGPDNPSVAITLSALAMVLKDESDFAGAQRLIERSLAIAEKALGPEHPVVAQTLNTLGLLRKEQGDLAGARSLIERALAATEKRRGPEHPETAQMLDSLAVVMRAQGDSAGARPLLERALAITEKTLGPDHVKVATCLSNLALLSIDQGDYAAARPLLERALAIREQGLGPEHPDVASSLNNLADVLKHQGDATGARALYERSLTIKEKVLGPDHPGVATSLTNLARLLQDQGELAAARPLLERALAIFEQSLGSGHPDVANCLNSLAVLDLDLGDVVAAVELTRRAAAGRSARLAEFLSASTESDSMRYVATAGWQIELLQSPVVVSREPIFSYESLLAWKGQVLRAARCSRAALRESIGPEGQELIDRLRQLSSSLSRNASRIGRQEAPADAASLQALSEDYQRVQRELAPLVAGVLPEAPSWDALRASLPTQAALLDLFVHHAYVPARRDGDTLVEKGHWTEPRVGAWITRGDSEAPVHVDLGPVAAIEAALHAALQATTGGRGQPLTSSPRPGSELRHLVWDPVASQLSGIDTVIVSPDGVLATLPFEILRGDDGRYLVEERAFVSLTDPTELVRLPARSAAVPGPLLAVGGVDYDHGDHDSSPSTSESAAVVASAAIDSTAEAQPLPRGGWAATWSALPATEEEASRVAAAHRAAFAQAHDTLLAGAAATEEALKASLPRSTVVHLATHGYFSPDGLPSLEVAAQDEADRQREAGDASQPSLSAVVRRLEGYSPGLLSGLVCAGANASSPLQRDDGYLTAEEVGWLDLHGVDLVVLSACDTGLGRPQSGEGLLGLRRAFLSAGARTVISSLWSVPDQETAELMDRFYRNLWQRQMGKLEALRAAQLEMIARNRELHGGNARPATWGAFVLDGDWR